MAQDDNVSVGAIDPALEAMINEGLSEDKDEDTTADDAKDLKEDSQEEQADEVKESEDDGASERDTEDKEETEEADDEGYVIDEGEEAEEEAVSVSSEENKTNPKLSPEESYILDNLSPITVTGTVDDKPVSIEVLAPEQLPNGFKFSDDKAREIASKQFNMLENRAQQLQNEFRTQQSSKAAQDFKKAEDAADRADIGELQRSGDIPRFKADVNSKDFDSDPAAQLIQSVLDYKESENGKYLEAYNQGKPYRHIGFEEAYLKYQKTHPAETRSEAQKQEDAERKGVARRTGTTNGTESKTKKDDVRITSTRDLYGYIDNLGWE